MIHWTHYTDEDQYARLCAYVSHKIWGEVRPFFCGTAMAVVKDGKLIGAVVFHNYDAQAGVIEMSAAAESPRWLSRRVLREMFAYPFIGLECQAVVMRTSAKNRRLARILAAYGFNRYDIPRIRGRDEAEAVYVLTEEAWRANGFHKELEHG